MATTKTSSKPTGKQPPVPPTLVLLVRHGQTPTTGKLLPGRAPGLHLADTGIEQARRAAERLGVLARIDAVYASADGGVEVVDWKSGGRGSLSDLQLAIYRLAWSQIAAVPLEQIDAAFVLVRTGEVVRPERLLDRVDVERLLSCP